jgi:hypothetical protein
MKYKGATKLTDKFKATSSTSIRDKDGTLADTAAVYKKSLHKKCIDSDDVD